MCPEAVKSIHHWMFLQVGPVPIANKKTIRSKTVPNPAGMGSFTVAQSATKSTATTSVISETRRRT